MCPNWLGLEGVQMGDQDRIFAELIQASLSVNAYEGQWQALEGSRLAGGLVALRAPLLHGSLDDVALPLARDVLRQLFDQEDVCALGGRQAVLNLAFLMNQLGSPDPRRIIIAMPVKHSLQVMRLNKGPTAAAVAPTESTCAINDDPRWPLYCGVPERYLQLPRFGFRQRRSLLRFGHYDRKAKPRLVCTRDKADAAGQPLYTSEQTNFTLATPDDLGRVANGYLSTPHLPATAVPGEGGKDLLKLPTLMVYQLQPGRGGVYTLMRMGVNISPCGRYLVAMSTKISKFAPYLAYYDRAWGPALIRALTC